MFARGSSVMQRLITNTPGSLGIQGFSILWYHHSNMRLALESPLSKGDFGQSPELTHIRPTHAHWLELVM